jgi:predicted dehydrogenase
MTHTIRTGIVGATVTQGGSGWGANAHVPALHLLPDYALQAVCTAHEDTAQASEEKFDARVRFPRHRRNGAAPRVRLLTGHP